MVKVSVTQVLSCTGPQTVATKGPPNLSRVSIRVYGQIFFVFERVNLRYPKNTNDSNFILYHTQTAVPKGYV